MKFVLATFNRDKARELRALIQVPWIELVPLYELEGSRVPPESGQTLVENALQKARAAVENTGMPAIADDTGLEVDALGGAPGIHAARYAGVGASYADNIAKLLDALKRTPPESRTARFHTVCVACFPEDEWMGRKPDRIGEGVLEGRIVEAPRGRGGFGYDPVFEVAGDGRTLAEISSAEKNALSHRARAAQDLVRKLSGA
jgi:XTP/dITP diphosphohydrolase